ncbi:unnamed protein product [Adineta ricciae]|uniref:TIL domain-containing protein n=1 Tax=Adineta ricciae TaxID=249248 RepID=A0A815MB48_ADIRI|nr:unnamed protein product [Adineta ricciae]CAF1421717.1 unnamed protein product [Adineta ricciae]
MSILRSAIVTAVIGLVCVFSIQVTAIPVKPSKQCCPEGEVYKSCGTACPLTCDDVLNTNSTKLCTLQCVSGCFCQEGYVRDKQNKGTCVRREQCNATTPATDKCSLDTEEFRDCGTACPETCADLNNSDSKPCSKQCVQGCFCKEGYVQDKENGTCIKREQCNTTTPPTKQCSKHEVYTTCGSACPLTCEDVINNTNKPCTLQCVQGCFCEEGYVRDTNKRGACIKRDKCKSNDSTTSSTSLVDN